MCRHWPERSRQDRLARLARIENTLFLTIAASVRFGGLASPANQGFRAGGVSIGTHMH